MADEISTASEINSTPTENVVGVENTGVVSLEMGIATMESISTDNNVVLPVLAHPNDVNFNVKYSKDYKGEKEMPEGNVIISKESAAYFESLGIGKTVK